MADVEGAEWMLAGGRDEEGVRNIGGEAFDRMVNQGVAEELGLQRFPSYVLLSSGVKIAGVEEPISVSQYTEEGPDPRDLLFSEPPKVLINALPSSGPAVHTSLALTTWMSQQREGFLVASAEKGQLATEFDWVSEMTDYLNNFGYMATVGGGTMPLEEVPRVSGGVENIHELHIAPNGTFTYMLSEMSNGVTLEQATDGAKKNGYAEPDAQNGLEVIRGETTDVALKATILFNVLGLGEDTLELDELNFKLTEDEILQLLDEIQRRRLVLSFYRDEDSEPQDTEIIGGFNISHNGWRIVAGFRKIDEGVHQFDEIAGYTGVQNGGLIVMNKNLAVSEMPFGGGNGAGAKDTVDSIVYDLRNKSDLNQNK